MMLKSLCSFFMQIGHSLIKLWLKIFIFGEKAPPGEMTAAAEDTERHHGDMTILGFLWCRSNISVDLAENVLVANSDVQKKHKISVISNIMPNMKILPKIIYVLWL